MGPLAVWACACRASWGTRHEHAAELHERVAEVLDGHGRRIGRRPAPSLPGGILKPYDAHRAAEEYVARPSIGWPRPARAPQSTRLERILKFAGWIAQELAADPVERHAMSGKTTSTVKTWSLPLCIGC